MPDQEVKKFEALAKGLEERPGLRLEIAGTADPDLDRVAIRIRKLKEQLLAMRQREQGQGSPKSEELSREDESRLVAELYEKPREQLEKALQSNPTGAAPKPPTVEDMKQRLAEAIPVDEKEPRALARQRGEHERHHVQERGGVAEDRG